MMEEFVAGLDESIQEVKAKMYGVVTGRVIDLADPLLLGRVRVQLPTIDALDLAPWARVATPMAGLLHGHYFIPNIGDEVLVAFEHGDTNVPYIIGSLWTALARPPLPSPFPQIRAIRTLAGNQLVFTEVPPSVTLQTGPTPPATIPAPPSPTGPYHTVMLSPAGIDITSPVSVRITVGTNTIVVTPGGIALTSGSNGIVITKDGINILGTRVTIAGSGGVSIAGSTVRINS